jgi:hypothetical protein
MATQKKTAKASSAKKPQLKVSDMKPKKDAKGGRSLVSKPNYQI